MSSAQLRSSNGRLAAKSSDCRVRPNFASSKAVLMSTPGRIVTTLLLLIWSVVCLFPLYWVVITSIKVSEFEPDGSTFIPFVGFAPTLDSWRYVLFDSHDDTVARAVSSIAVAASATLICLVLGAMAAYALVQLRTRLPLAPETTLLALMATRILPPCAIVLPIYLTLQYLGMIDSILGLTLVYAAVNLPIAVWLLANGFRRLPRDVLDAAALDGASNVRLLLDMALPLAAAEVAATALLVFILCWNEFALAAVLTTDHALTLPAYLVGQMAVREQMASTEPQWGNFSTIIVLMVAPLLLGAGVLQRLLARSFVGRDRTGYEGGT